MNKKDIYEHLSQIYLDASQKKKKISLTRNITWAGLFFILGVAIFFYASSRIKENVSLNSQIALVLQPDAVKINFHFDPAKKETYTLDLKQLDLRRFKAMSFALKKSNWHDNISLRVEFSNIFKEKSEIYLKNIPYKWQNYQLNLADFKNIGDWSKMLSLVFTVEEWNTKDNKGIVYLDNVQLLR